MEKALIGFAIIVMGIMSTIFVVLGLFFRTVLTVELHMIGIALMMVGGAFLLMMLILIRMMKKATSSKVFNGTKVQAELIEVKENTTITINGKHPYSVLCTYEEKVYESECFYENVHRFDGQTTVDLYLDEQSDEYIVDIQS